MAKSKENGTQTPTSGLGNGESREPAEPSYEQVQRLAYAIWESRDGSGAAPDDDWFEAERQLREETMQTGSARF